MSFNEKSIAIHWLINHIGKPYIWGGNNSIEGFDCSGFVLEFLRSFTKLKLKDITSQQLLEYFKKQNPNFIRMIKNETIQFGDILFYGKSRNKITHVAIAIAPNLLIDFPMGPC